MRYVYTEETVVDFVGLGGLIRDQESCKGARWLRGGTEIKYYVGLPQGSIFRIAIPPAFDWSCALDCGQVSQRLAVGVECKLSRMRNERRTDSAS
jgi:hypothetical protein